MNIYAILKNPIKYYDDDFIEILFEAAKKLPTDEGLKIFSAVLDNINWKNALGSDDSVTEAFLSRMITDELHFLDFVLKIKSVDFLPAFFDVPRKKISDKTLLDLLDRIKYFSAGSLDFCKTYFKNLLKTDDFWFKKFFDLNQKYNFVTEWNFSKFMHDIDYNVKKHREEAIELFIEGLFK